MSLRLAVLKSVFNSYNAGGFPLIFFFIALVFMIIKEKKEQINLLIYEIFGILLLVTPFIGNKIITLNAGTESNWPVYGILCVIPLTAYIATELLKEAKNRKEQCIFVLLLILVIELGFGF